MCSYVLAQFASTISLQTVFLVAAGFTVINCVLTLLLNDNEMISKDSKLRLANGQAVIIGGKLTRPKA